MAKKKLSEKKRKCQYYTKNNKESFTYSLSKHNRSKNCKYTTYNKNYITPLTILNLNKEAQIKELTESAFYISEKLKQLLSINLVKIDFKLEDINFTIMFTNQLCSYFKKISEFQINKFELFPELYPKRISLYKEKIEEELDVYDDLQPSLKKLGSKYGANTSTVRNYLYHNMGFRYRNMSNLNYRGQCVLIKYETVIYSKKLIELISSNNQVIYFDESKFVTAKRQKKMWIKKDTENHIFIPDSYNSSNLLIAMTNKKVSYYELHYTENNSDVLSNFFTNFNNDYFNEEKLNNDMSREKTYIILDNSKIHSCMNFKKKVDGLNFNFLYLPRYRPFYNPVEFFFQFIKEKFYRNFYWSE